jgi:DNA-binding Lrp family transcriptional regulator
MISAIILVNTEPQSQEQVLKSIKIIEGVEEAHELYGGVYDLIVKTKASSIEELKDITRLGIRNVEGVSSSLTLMVVAEPIQRMQRLEDSASTQDSGHFEPLIEVQNFLPSIH